MIVYREALGMKLFFVCTLLICLGLKSYAQNEIGLIPQINSDFKIGKRWKVNSKLEGRQIFFKNPFPAGKHEKEFDRFDVELIATKSVPGEFYLKLNHEYLGILQDSTGNLEIRGLTSVESDISDKNKVETGVC